MEAKVQYNDYRGTTAADRCDLFEELPGQMTEIIFEKFQIPLEADEYHFVGVSVYGSKVEDMGVLFFFKNNKTREVVKYHKSSVALQLVLDMFKRFEFQVGEHLEDIDGNKIREIEGDNCES